jgi:hypothetical protein
VRAVGHGDASSRLRGTGRGGYAARRRRVAPSFYLRLTEFGPGGNPLLRSVCVMTQHLTSAAGREDNGFPRPQAGDRRALSADPLASGPGADLGVRPGESNPARMLSGVLLLAVAVIIMALVLAWWLV